MVWELAPKLVVIFRHLNRGGSFPACWRVADVVQVAKEFSSSDAGDYRPIFIMPVLSKVFEKIVAEKLFHYLKVSSLLPPLQFLCRKGLGICDALLTPFTPCRLLWTGAWKEGLLSWTSQLCWIWLVSAVCCIS